jgi:hypothetical protein
MKYKTLLLGTAAVFAVAGGARAADLAVAESVEYVKVCDAYGEGFFYIPGSDTCIKISGTMDVWVQWDSQKIHDGTVTNKSGEDDLNYLFQTEADVTFQAKSMTDWGMLTSVINFRGDEALGSVATIWAERAYITLGGFTAGLLESQYDQENGEIPFGIIGGGNFDGDDNTVLQFTYTFKQGPVGFAISAEDPNFNPTPATPFEEFSPIPGYSAATATGAYPNIIATLFGNAPGSSGWSWSGNFGVMDTTAGTGYGTKWTFNYKGPAGFQAGIMGGVSNGAGSYFGNNIAPDAYGSGTYWMVEGSVGFALSSAASLWFLAGYQAAPGHSAYELQAEWDWTVAKDAIVGLAAGYTSKGPAGGSGLGTNDNFSDAAVQLRFRRNFGGGAID